MQRQPLKWQNLSKMYGRGFFRGGQRGEKFSHNALFLVYYRGDEGLHPKLPINLAATVKKAPIEASPVINKM